MEYRISGERLRGIADQVRRLGKIGGEMRPGQMEEVLGTMEPAERMITYLKGGEQVMGLVKTRIDHQALSETVIQSVGYAWDNSTPDELSGHWCHYGDALLPGIPEEMLEEFPFAFIRRNDTDRVYQLIFSQSGFYRTDTVLRDNNGQFSRRYEFPTGNTEETVWRNKYNVATVSWTLDGNRYLIWSNFDIPLGTPESEEVFAYGSEPEPLGKFYFNGTLLPGLARNMLEKYPYTWIRKNENSGYYDLFYSTEPFYIYDSSAMSGAGITKPWYRIPIEGSQNAAMWTYYQESKANLVMDTLRTALWANHDILNSKDAEATDIYFAGSEPVPAE